jgi:hypothetical protein
VKVVDPDEAMRKKAAGRLGGKTVTLVPRLKEEVKGTLAAAGLSQEEIEHVESLSVCYPVDCETDGQARALVLFQALPRPAMMGVLDADGLWRSLAVDDFQYGLRAVVRMREVESGDSRFAALGRRVADWLWAKMEEWPLTAGQFVSLIPKERGLNRLWQEWLAIRRVLGDAAWAIGPSEFYFALPEVQRAGVEVDCWDSDDEQMARLVKASVSVDSCAVCGVVAAKMYGWSWGNCTRCPRCNHRGLSCSDVCGHWTGDSCGRGRDRDPLAPTLPELGVAEYQWALRHGMMWPEFVAWKRDESFDQAAKVKCPRVEECQAWCAQEQRSGAVGWPPVYPQECRWFCYFEWRDSRLGGTVEEYLEVRRREIEKSLSSYQRKRGPVTRERALAEMEEKRPGVDRAGLAMATSGGDSRVQEPEPQVLQPRLF